MYKQCVRSVEIKHCVLHEFEYFLVLVLLVHVSCARASMGPSAEGPCLPSPCPRTAHGSSGGGPKGGRDPPPYPTCCRFARRGVSRGEATTRISRGRGRIRLAAARGRRYRGRVSVTYLATCTRSSNLPQLPHPRVPDRLVEVVCDDPASSPGAGATEELQPPLCAQDTAETCRCRGPRPRTECHPLGRPCHTAIGRSSPAPPSTTTNRDPRTPEARSWRSDPNTTLFLVPPGSINFTRHDKCRTSQGRGKHHNLCD